MQNSKMKATVLSHGVSSFFSFVLVISVLLPGCQADECHNKPVGIADPKKIPDNSFTASSYYSNMFVTSPPKDARLNLRTRGWAPSSYDDPNDYLQIDLGQVFVLCAVATQGSAFTSQWVTQYKISTSVDNIVWTAYPNNASPKLFDGNKDGNTVVKNILNPSVQAKFIRFTPTEFNKFKSLRVEAYECVADPIPCNDSDCRNGGTCHGCKDAYKCSCPYGYTGKHCETNTVRIQGGGSSGRLQVLHTGVWGTVCGFYWSMNNTHVACRQLGFPGALSYYNSGGGTGHIWLDDVQCSGSESVIQQCGHSGWGRHSCGHYEDVFVACYRDECSNYTVLNSSDRAASYKGITSKCDMYDITKGWYRFMEDAGTIIATTCVPSFHCGTNVSGWMQGSLPNIFEGIVNRTVCYTWNSNCCYWKNNIRVRNCGEFYLYELVKTPRCFLRYCGANLKYTVRIQGGGSSGRLQVLHNGVWGTVCGFYWSMNNTHLVCRQLGFPGALSYTNSDGGTGPIWLGEVKCSGSETDIQQCRHNGWESHDCFHYEDVFVTCNSTDAVRIHGGGSSGRLQVFHNGTWGTVCDDYWSMTNTHVVCHQLGFPGVLSYHNSGGGAGPIWLDDVQCSGNESAIQQCGHRGWGSHDCRHDEVVFVTCNTTDSCNSSPCRNNGTCYNVKGTYNCSCPYGYTGQQCQSYVNFCASDPCRNGGTCINNSNEGYNCSCPYGFTGRQCETTVNFCASGPCRNGGTCNNTYNEGYNCSCPYGFTGRQCETTVNFCASGPCRNGGTCNNTSNEGYNCSCPYGFTDRQCETKSNEKTGTEKQEGEETSRILIALMFTGVALVAVTVLVLIIVLLVILKNA